MHSLLNRFENLLGLPRPKIVTLHFTDADLNQFVEQVNFLERLNYKFVLAREVAECVAKTRKINDHSVCLTFDTNNLKILKFAFHFLKSRNINATVFARANTEKYIVKGLVDMGWEVGSFGKTDCDLSDKQAFFKKEIIESKQILEEKIGQPILTFAYPAGKYCKYATRNVIKAGYTGAFSTQKGFLSQFTKKTLIPRIEVCQNCNLESFDSNFRHWRRVYWSIASIWSRVRGVQGELSALDEAAAGLSP